VSGVTCTGMITNISMGGCQFVMDQLNEQEVPELKAGDNVTLTFQTPEGTPIESLSGEVRNIKSADNRVEIGIRFLDLQGDIKAALTECIRNLAMAGKLVS
jgi:hypothetical protein